MRGITLEAVYEARLERAIDFVRAGLAGRVQAQLFPRFPPKLAAPRVPCPRAYAALAWEAIARAASLSALDDESERIERAIEITRSAYATCEHYPKALLETSLLDGLGLTMPGATPSDSVALAIHYTEVAALALRLSVLAGDFV